MTIQIYFFCASNGSKFLEAMNFCAEILTKRIFIDDLVLETKEQDLLMSEAAELAGGIIYFDFYRMLLS